MGKKEKREKKRAHETETDYASDAQVKEELQSVENGDSNEKKKKKKKKRNKEEGNVDSYQRPTVSIALPGSIIHNAQSLELATRLAGQIARAATIFRVDEVVVFDNKNSSMDEATLMEDNNADENESGSAFLMRILRYLETPQYLRKSLFPRHNSLRFVGLLPPLDAPHHLRKHEWAPYREGVTLKGQGPHSTGTLVDIGLNKSVIIDQVIEPGKRVTVATGSNRNLDAGLTYQVVPSSRPRDEVGTYWGYTVRYAPNISGVFSGCPYKGGYDHMIGTSEHGVVVKSSELSLPSFRHLLIAFGGLAGLEECVEEDNNLKGKDVRELFNLYVNICPHQGSRTIRTEEAVFICMQYFQEPISRVLERSKQEDWREESCQLPF
ncbi:OLC1v1020138C1 [Oldenlandia corymbosa var. corymbosa]|uniref:OLC1v1020138C1 n=1 Tax=Oldenlandia corymbosa var. corymbosa TaxID=529605 RepID=A0AAV1EFM1_OLDCO|nr:OLC1v1020138C1 [Oldenlandia corymbosa var. corymbosa]